MPILLEFPLSGVCRVSRQREMPWKWKAWLQTLHSNSALVRSGRSLVSLTFYAKIQNVVPADGTAFNHNGPGPGYSHPSPPLFWQPTVCQLPLRLRTSVLLAPLPAGPSPAPHPLLPDNIPLRRQMCINIFPIFFFINGLLVCFQVFLKNHYIQCCHKHCNTHASSFILDFYFGIFGWMGLLSTRVPRS